MERVVSKKKQAPDPNNFAHPEDYSRTKENFEMAGGPTPRPQHYRAPPKVPDPAQRPKYMLDGYSEVHTAFIICGHDNKNVLTVSYREKRYDERTATRVYYAGAILLGSINMDPLHVGAHFRHSLDTQGDALFPDLEKAEAYLRRLLLETPK